MLGAEGHPSSLVRTAHRFGYGFSGVVEKATRAGVKIAAHWVVAGTRRIPLSEGENLIGRDPTAAVWLDVSGVSRRHASVLIGEGTATLQDLGSKNGTMLGDRLVTGPTPLHDDDRIHLGRVQLVFHVAASGMSTETLTRHTTEPHKQRPR